MTNYKVVYNTELRSLEKEVNAMLDQDYLPLGGMVQTEGAFYQTLVKYGPRRPSKEELVAEERRLMRQSRI